MIARDGKDGSPVSDEVLVGIFERQVVTTRTLLAHLQFHGDAEVIEVSYHEALEDPSSVAMRLKALLGEGFDPEKASKAVEPSLYRTRNKS